MTWSATADVGRFDEAVDWFGRRTVLRSDQLRAIDADAQARSFWVGAGLQIHEIQSVFDSLEKALEKGQSFDDWRALVRDTLTNDAHAETVFRNATQRAYSAGRHDQMSDPDILELRPYWMFDAILDGRTTKDICLPRNRTILPANHPWWKRNWPPLHHRCRSGVQNLSEEEARRLGVATDPPDTPDRDGWGRAPGDDPPWRPDAKKIDPELHKELKRKARVRPPRPKKYAAHNPQHWDEHYKEFGGAAPTLAKGRAAIERGLDMTLSAARQALAPIADLPGPAFFLKGAAAMNGASTIRELGGETDWRMRGLAGLAGHLRSVKQRKSEWTHPDLTGEYERKIAKWYSTVLGADFKFPSNWRFAYRPGDVEWANATEFGAVVYNDMQSLSHEIGHLLEWSRGVKTALDFLARRTAGQKSELLRDLTGYADYGSAVAIPDDFADPYVGRKYDPIPSICPSGASEVTSMGVEWLAMGSRASASGFVRFLLDIDHLSFTLGQLAGK